MVFCVSCGEKLADRANFCANCGAGKVEPAQKDEQITQTSKVETSSEGAMNDVAKGDISSQADAPLAVASLSVAPKMFWTITPIWWAALAVSTAIVLVLIIFADILVFGTPFLQALTTLGFAAIAAVFAVVFGGFVWSLPLYTSARNYLLGTLPPKDMALRTVLYSACLFLVLSVVIFISVPELEYQFLTVVGSLWLGIASALALALTCVFGYKFSHKTATKLSAAQARDLETTPKKWVNRSLIAACLIVGLLYISLIHISGIFQERRAIIAAAHGDTEKTFELAEKYQFGDELFLMSNKKFLHYLKKASASGHGKANYKLAQEYLDNDDLPNYRKYLEKSAEAGYVYGQDELSTALRYGYKGFVIDPKRALFWQEKAHAKFGANTQAD